MKAFYKPANILLPPAFSLALQLISANKTKRRPIQISSDGGQEVEEDPQRWEEGFEAFELGWMTSLDCFESRAALTMQGKYSSSSITGPGRKQSLCCPPSGCNNERTGAERGRPAWAAGQKISHRAVHCEALSQLKLQRMWWRDASRGRKKKLFSWARVIRMWSMWQKTGWGWNSRKHTYTIHIFKTQFLLLSGLLTYLFLLLLWRFNNSRVRLPGLAKVVEQGQGIYQEGHVDSGKWEMCSQVKEHGGQKQWLLKSFF